MLSYLRKKMKTIMIIVAVLFAATMFYGLGYTGLKGTKESSKKGSIATINGKEIDHKRLEQTIQKLFSKETERISPEDAMLYQTIALQQVIDFTIMLNEAKRDVSTGKGEVDQAIDQIMQANKIPNRDALKGALKNMGQDYNDFRNNVKEEILVAKMVNKVQSQVTITADDLKEIKARHILVIPKSGDKGGDLEAKAKAEELLLKIKKGENFSTLAAKYSDDQGSSRNGGDLGFFTTGMMVPEFEKAAFLLRPGEVSDIVKTQYGYHIIKLEDTRLRKIKEKGKDLNEEVLAAKQEQAFKKWTYQLSQKTKVEINDPLIKAHSLYLMGKLNEAISAYNEASMDNPSNPYIHLFLGNAYVRIGNTEFALLEYGKASQFSGADPNLLIAVGDVYQALKKKDLALESYRKASLIAGDNKEMHKELKKTFEKIGAKSDAAKERSEIARIEKKENFEKEIQQKLGN
ncbi:MAG: peptidylprolyl isomerase [bacterium]